MDSSRPQRQGRGTLVEHREACSLQSKEAQYYRQSKALYSAPGLYQQYRKHGIIHTKPRVRGNLGLGRRSTATQL